MHENLTGTALGGAHFKGKDWCGRELDHALLV